jgi:alpha-D-ribose 1-methylphosphonate 5-triphosphate synthase subunit PhnH
MATTSFNKLPHFDFTKAWLAIGLSQFNYDNMVKFHASAKLMADLVEADLVTVFTGIVQYKLVCFNPHAKQHSATMAKFLTQLWLAADRDQYQDIVNSLVFHSTHGDISLLWDDDDGKFSLFPAASDDDQF